MNRLSVARKQTKILKKIHKLESETPAQPDHQYKFCKEIAKRGQNSMYKDLGDIGLKLHRFCSEIDLEDPHPDLQRVVNDDFHNDFLKLMLQVLKVVDFTKESSLCASIAESATNLIHNSRSATFVARSLDGPSYNLRNVRFVTSRLRRDQIRAAKRSQEVNLRSYLEQGREKWESQPKNFDDYINGHNRYTIEIEQATEAAERFRGMGLSSMTADIETSIEKMKAMVETGQHCGFNQIDLHVAAAILAQLHGFEIYQYDSYGDKLGAICKVSDFEGYDFCDEASDWKMEYRPHMYTLEEMSEVYSAQNLEELVDYLEEFPAMGGKPLFDHYRIVLPSVKLPFASYRKFRRANGEEVEYSRYDRAAQRNFDVEFLKAKQTVGILLGERDGTHYFISYWM